MVELVLGGLGWGVISDLNRSQKNKIWIGGFGWTKIPERNRNQQKTPGIWEVIHPLSVTSNPILDILETINFVLNKKWPYSFKYTTTELLV